MDDRRIGRVMRALRHRRGWRQVDLAHRSRVSASAISDIELGRIGRYTVATLRAAFGAVDAGLAVDLLWGGRGDLGRLLDADHARLQDDWARRKRAAGWEVWPEASFNHYGDRGRIDLLSYHPPSATLDVTEVKSGIWDIQELIGTLDVKLRVARRLALERGWRPRHVVASLIVADGRTARRRVADHPQLFARFSLRGRAVSAWLRQPEPTVAGVLEFVSLPDSNQRRLGQAGRRRVRLARSRASADQSGAGPPADADAA